MDSHDEKTYRTLGGFLKGREPEETTYFAYSATLRIFGEDLDLDGITRQIGIQPTYSHRKGQKRPRSSEFSTDMWSYSPPIPEDRPLSEHIDALWATIRPAREYLMSLKRCATVDVFLGYRSNVDHAGIQVPHPCLEMFTSLEIPFGVSIIIT
jgi:hypothetical protein